MPLQDLDIVQVAIRGRIFAQRVILTQHYVISQHLGVETTTADLQALLTRVGPAGAQSIFDPYLACLPPQYQAVEMRAQRLRPVRSAYAAIGVAAFVGTHISNTGTTNVHSTILRRTDRSGRRQVSTLKIGPAPVGAVVDGLIVAPYKLILNTLASAMQAKIVVPAPESFDATPIVFHPDLAGAASYDFLETFFIGDEGRVITRRTVGRGE